MPRKLFKSDILECIVCGANKENMVTLWQFPKSPERKQIWMKSLGIVSTKSNSRVCDKHFGKDQFVRTKLKKDAIPSRTLPSKTKERMPLGVSGLVNILPKITGQVHPLVLPITASQPHQAPSKIISPQSYYGFNGQLLPVNYEHNLKDVDMDGINHLGLELETSSEHLQSEVALKEPLPDPDTICQRDSAKLQKLKLRRQIYKLRQKLKNARQKADAQKGTVDVGEVFKENPSFLHFLKGQIKRSHQKLIKYSSNEKSIALSIFYACGRNGYRMLADLGIHLPAESSLRLWTKEFNFPPGLSNKLLETIRHVTQGLSSQDRDCVLVWDEMHIKELIQYNKFTDKLEGIVDLGPNIGRKLESANEVLVFMVQGINMKWKFPLSYHFSNNNTRAEDLGRLVQEHIIKLNSIDLKVRICICDMAFTNRSLYKTWNVSEAHPYCNYNDKKVYFIHDTPHLVKLVRNNLMKYDFIIKKKIGNRYIEKKIKWLHILNFYNKDRRLTTRMAPKLTNMHMFVKDYSKMKVKLATQVLSHSVYAGMMAMISCNVIKSDSVATANFVKNIDNLFDLLNISKYSDDKPSRNAKNFFNNFSQLDDHLNYLNEIEIPKYPHSPEFLVGLKLSLNGIKLLCDDLKQEGYELVYTRQLQQDCLENFFSRIRMRGGNCLNPTAMQFRQNFKCLFLARLLKNPLTGNTENSFESVIELERVKEPNFNGMPTVQNHQVDCVIAPPSKSKHFYGRNSKRSLKLGKQQEDSVVSYFGPVCVLAIYEKNRCAQCSEMLVHESNSASRLVDFKQFEECNKMTTLTNETTRIFLHLNRKFDEFTQISLKSDGSEIVAGVLNQYLNDYIISQWLESELGCKLHRTDMIKYFIRTKIHRIVKDKNEAVKKSKAWDQTRRELRNQ